MEDAWVGLYHFHVGRDDVAVYHLENGELLASQGKGFHRPVGESVYLDGRVVREFLQQMAHAGHFAGEGFGPVGDEHVEGFGIFGEKPFLGVDALPLVFSGIDAVAEFLSADVTPKIPIAGFVAVEIGKIDSFGFPTYQHVAEVEYDVG